MCLWGAVTYIDVGMPLGMDLHVFGCEDQAVAFQVHVKGGAFAAREDVVPGATFLVAASPQQDRAPAQAVRRQKDTAQEWDGHVALQESFQDDPDAQLDVVVGEAPGHSQGAHRQGDKESHGPAYGPKAIVVKHEARRADHESPEKDTGHG